MVGREGWVNAFSSTKFPGREAFLTNVCHVVRTDGVHMKSHV